MQLQGEKVTVAIVDDHDAIRLAFKVSCPGYDFELLAAEPSVENLLQTLGDQVPQVVVLDLSLADGSLVEENVTRVRELGSQVLIFSIADKRNLVRSAIKAGAAAIVPKAQSMDELAEAIRLVASGVYVNNTQTTAAIDSDLEFKEAKLSPREREICDRIRPELRKRGLIFVGIDVIGGKWLTEINVTSPTGIVAIDAFNGTDTPALIWDTIEAKLAK